MKPRFDPNKEARYLEMRAELDALNRDYLRGSQKMSLDWDPEENSEFREWCNHNLSRKYGLPTRDELIERNRRIPQPAPAATPDPDAAQPASRNEETE